jgi:hypothetical protein
MQLSLETALVETVAYIQGRALQIFTERLTKSSGGADGALEQAVISATDVVNSLKI